MTIEKFKKECKEWVGFNIVDGITMYTDPVEIWDERTNERTQYNTLDEALGHKIDGKTVKEIIESLDKLCVPDIIND